MLIRPRRLRKNQQIRDLVSQTKLLVEDLVMPYFVLEGKHKKEPIASMPGIYRLSIDNLIRDVKEAKDLGIKAVLIFGICQKKDALATESYSGTGIVQRAIKAVKANVKDIIVITDVCLCGYTSHGHCGIVLTPNSASRRLVRLRRKLLTPNCIIDNDKTLKILAKISLSHAQAGADLVAPSAMMDGQVKAIREALDNDGFPNTGILAYSAKYASNFYGPFREALGSSPAFGDRKTYQMDFRNSDEALREIKQDIDEGADIVMVKPALAYLDIVYRARQEFNILLAAFNVSGEYAMVKAHNQSKEQEKSLVLEILAGIKRAGADLIITYHAKEVAKWLNS